MQSTAVTAKYCQAADHPPISKLGAIAMSLFYLYLHHWCAPFDQATKH
jgi:hypothetical protein